MKRILISLLLLLPMPAMAEQCDDYGLYAFLLKGCPQEEVRPRPDLTIPLCEQEGFKQYAYMDHRCYISLPFDYDSMCYDWNCAVPYDHQWIEPLSGIVKTHRGGTGDIDMHYRACREGLGQCLSSKRRR